MLLNASIASFARRSTAALPLATSPPAFTVAAGGLIHIVAMDASNQRAVHVALDRDGAAVSEAAALPISLLSVGACRGEVVVTGIHADNGIRWTLAVDTEGTVRWQTALPIPTAGLVWVVPACVAGEPVIVWEVEKDTTGELGVATLSRGNLDKAETSAQAGVAFGLDVATIGSSIFVLRSRGAQRSGDILRIEGGTVASRAQTAHNAHAIAAVGDRLAVLAWTPRAVLLYWLDARLVSLGSPETIATAEAPSSIRYATLHAGGEGRIAVSYLAETAGDLVPAPSGRSEPATCTRHFLGLYDAASRSLADVTEVQPAGTAWLSGAWLGDRLFFVHGTTGAALSIFERCFTQVTVT